MDTEEAVALLLTVARLGESDLSAWWASQCFSPAGRFLLPRTYPHTWRPAAGELVLLTAKRAHEHAFDHRRTALHLFSDRLPALAWTTSWLSEQKTTRPPDPLFDLLLSWTSPEQVHDSLSARVGTATHGGEPVAAHLNLGSLTARQLDDPVRAAQAIRELASAYVGQTGMLSVPYFDLA